MTRARRSAWSNFRVVGRQPVGGAFIGPMWPVRVPDVPRGERLHGSPGSARSQSASLRPAVNLACAPRTPGAARRGAGVKNEGNACYVNALAQSLVALNVLRPMPRSASRRAGRVEKALFRDFGTLLEDTEAPAQLCLVSVVDVILGRGTRGTQQDAAEFFQMLLGRVPGLAAAFEDDRRVVLEPIAVASSERGEGIAILVSIGGDAARTLAHALGGVAGPPQGGSPDACRSDVLMPASIAVEVPRTTRGNGSQCKNKHAFVCAPRLLLGGRDYLLVAAVVHLGEESTSGHLVAIVLRNGAWFLCDDDNVRRRARPLGAATGG
eukprot:scaffold2498_cov227-Pavlova_lutheri.AAC.1